MNIWQRLCDIVQRLTPSNQKFALDRPGLRWSLKVNKLAVITSYRQFCQMTLRQKKIFLS